MWKKWRAKIGIDSPLGRFLIKAASWGFILQIGLSALTFLSSVLLARLGGDEGFGIYSLVFSWLLILQVAANMGLDDLLLKELPIFKDQKAWGKRDALLAWAEKRTLWASLLLMFGFYLLLQYTHFPGLSNYADYYFWALPIIPAYAFLQLWQSALRAEGQMSWGQLGDRIVQPLLFFAFLALLYLFAYPISDLGLIAGRSLSFVLAAGLAFWLWRRYRRAQPKAGNWPKLDLPAYKKASFYFNLGSLLYLLNSRIDILFLGFFELLPEQIAYYNVALKFSDIALIPYLVLTTVSLPTFSSLYHQGKLQELGRLYQRSTALITLAILAVLAIFIAFGPYFLLIYGPEYQQGYTALVWLCLGKGIHVLVGPVSQLLALVGQEKMAAYLLAVSLAITAILQYSLIPVLGIDGAAIAAFMGLAVFDLSLAYWAYRKLGFWPIAYWNRK